MAKSKHRRKPQGYKPHSFGNSRLMKGLNQACELAERHKYQEAKPILDDLHQQFPANADVIQNLAYVENRLGNDGAYLRLCEKLYELKPNEPMHALALATAYGKQQRLALMLRTVDEFLARWPAHEQADSTREMRAVLKKDLAKMLDEFGLTEADGVKLAELHERLQGYLTVGEFAAGVALGQQIIERYPHFAPAYNNLSQIYYYHGKTEEAVATTKKVLEFQPDNFQASANLARMLWLSGRREEAQPYAERLKAMQSDNPDIWIKQAETFSFMGDDEAVLEAYRNAQAAGAFERPFPSPLLPHLAGAAALFLGRESEARTYWQQALKISPNFELTQANLKDLNQPVGMRHGPWAYDLRHWLPRAQIEQMIAQTQSAGRSPASLERSLRQHLENHPELSQLLPILLERADAGAADFVLRLAGGSKQPALLEAVKQFALGQRGADNMRLRAAQIAVENELIPAGHVPFWTKGTQTEVILFNTEITGEPQKTNWPPKVQRLAEKGFHQMRAGDPAYAEQLFKEAIKLAPREASLHNNLAQAYKLMGRDEEAEQLLDWVETEFPDYFFSIINRARKLTERGEVEAARKVLAPQLQRKKMHLSEMAMICTLQIEMALKQGEMEAARQWFDIFEQVYPDHPNLDAFRPRLQKPDLRNLFDLPSHRRR